MLNAEDSFMCSVEENILSLNQKAYDRSNTERKYQLAIGSMKDISDLLLTIMKQVVFSYNLSPLISKLVYILTTFLVLNLNMQKKKKHEHSVKYLCSCFFVVKDM